MADEDFPIISAPSEEAKASPKPSVRPREAAVRTVQKPAPSPAPQAVPKPSHADDDDPEALLRQYSDRQKAKIARLEQQLGGLTQAISERDALREKVESLGKALSECRMKLEEAGARLEKAKGLQDAAKELKQKLDAALLSNEMSAKEIGTLKKRLQDADAARKSVESRITAAIKTLQSPTK